MRKNSASIKFIILITLGLFISEVTSMGIIALIPSISYLTLSIIDATLLILFATPLLYYFSLRPLLNVTSEREAEIVRRQEIEMQLRVQTTAVETAANGIIITNRNGEIIWGNNAFSQISGYPIEDALGQTPRIVKSGLQDLDFYKKLWDTILSGEVWHGEIMNRRKDGKLYIAEVTITPVLNSLGEIQNFIAILQDVTERKRAESITQTRLRLTQFASSHTLDELLKTTLDEIEFLTGSTAGFFHFIEPDQKTLRLQTWSTHTLENLCKANPEENHYDLDQAGVWADCVRQRKPIIHNDYESLSNRKGMPEGHAPVIRELTIPILRDEKVVAILGVGNKPLDYTASDVELVTALADFAWDVIGRKRDEIALRKSEEKFRTLLDWTYDWEIWMSTQNKVMYNSPSCERITGYQPDEFIADPDLLIKIVHPEDRKMFEAHMIATHDELSGPITMEYRIITCDGNERWIDHNCRPIFGAENQYLGRRVSNRDITERKQAEKEAMERNLKEKALIETMHTMQIDIARDLHDTIGQNISFLRMSLDRLSDAESYRQANLPAEIQNMSKVADETYDLIRGMLAMLQAGNSDDPLDLFTRYAGHVAKRSLLEVNVLSWGDSKQLTSHQMRQLFFVFREALTNIEKYAQPCQAISEFIWDEDRLTLNISDNGHGFDISNIRTGDHYGLKFMRERVELLKGLFSIESKVGSGTNIRISIPYE